MFITGKQGSGKTAICRHILQNKSIPHAYIDCFKNFTQRHLFEDALDQIIDGFTDDKKYVYSTCDDPRSFARELQHIYPLVHSFNHKQQHSTAIPHNYDDHHHQYGDNQPSSLPPPLVLVFDNVESLRKVRCHLLSAILALPRICPTIYLSIVLISHLPWQDFATFYDGANEPITIRTSQLSHQARIEAVCVMATTPHQAGGNSSVIKEEQMVLFRHFLELVNSVVMTFMTSPSELALMAFRLWPIYTEPLQKNPRKDFFFFHFAR